MKAFDFSIIQARFKTLVYDRLRHDFKDDFDRIDLSKVDRLIENGASLKEISIRVREAIAVEQLKEKNNNIPGSPIL